MSISGAVIRRVDRPADRFTIISNGFHRDMRLSFAARGLGGWLLSHADGFEITSVGIARQAGIGRDQVRRWLAELEHYGYLRRTRARGDGGRLGSMVYEVRCSPFDPQPDGHKPRSSLRLADQAQAEQAPGDAHHKKTSSKNIISNEDSPSGGSADADGLDSQEEPPMPRTTPDQPGLFDIPASKPDRTPAAPAQAVVAAFVDSHRQQHGSDPTRSEIGRVARDVKRLIGNPATVEQLVAAAAAMGRTPFANIAVQLKKVNTSTGKGLARAHPHGSPEWAALAAETDREAQAGADEYPELDAWRAGVAATA